MCRKKNMKTTPGKSKSSPLGVLLKRFKTAKSPNPVRVVQPDNLTEPVRIVTSRVMLVIYDPVIDPASGIKLSKYMKWQSPDYLANACIHDILEASGGMARYQIVQRVELNEFPVKVDGYRYDPQTYLDVLKGVLPSHKPEGADYQAILNGLKILPRIAKREIDEVWLFAFPQAGFFESSMGGAGAFWCNSPPMSWTSTITRQFIVMGFSYERGVGEMLESFGHRSESLISKAFNCQDFVAWAYAPGRVPATIGLTLNLFQQYLCFDQIAPGRSGIGSIHYAPNSDLDYDWNNPRIVSSNCHDWYNFPKFQNDIRQVNASEWGSGDIYAHHKWWLKHLPKVAGRTNGVANNWWQYVIDPNLIHIV
jgi:hypothetical protein